MKRIDGETKILNKEVRSLSVRLTDEERLEKADELAKSLAKKDQLERDHSNLKAQMKREESAINAEVGSLQQIVSNRAEYRDVECVMQGSFESPMVEVIRLDTGECIDVRQLNMGEKSALVQMEKDAKQMGLLPEEPAPDAPSE